MIFLYLFVFSCSYFVYSDDDSSKQHTKWCTYMCFVDYNLTNNNHYHLSLYVTSQDSKNYFYTDTVPGNKRIQILFSRIKHGTCTFVTKIRSILTLIADIKCAGKRRGAFNINESNLQRLIPRHPVRPLGNLQGVRHDIATSTRKPNYNPERCRRVCIANRTSIFTDPKILEISIQKMTRALRLNKRNLTVFRNGKGCLEDHRAASRVMGGVGVIVILCTALTLLAADFHTFVITRKMSIKPKNKKVKLNKCHIG